MNSIPPTVEATPSTSGDDHLPDRLLIRELVEGWVVWRDCGDWERFATVWHDDGYMSATWFRGGYRDFIEASREALSRGARILHFLGGCNVDVSGNRSIAQTKMTINQRDFVHDTEVDVVCTGRFYDFLERRDSRWGIVRRQPIYEQDRMDPVDPATTVELDQDLLGAWPSGYRHLAYLQTQAGYAVAEGGPGLPGLSGPVVENLYRQGAAWIDGAPTPGQPL